MKLEPADPQVLEALRHEHHRGCFVHRPGPSFGLGVRFTIAPGGGVEATVHCPEDWEGYPGFVHGGILATLVDGAMTNALFAHGIVAFTAEMACRFKRSVELGGSIRITAAAEPYWPRVYRTTARIEQDGAECVTATGTFMAR